MSCAGLTRPAQNSLRAPRPARGVPDVDDVDAIVIYLVENLVAIAAKNLHVQGGVGRARGCTWMLCDFRNGTANREKHIAAPAGLRSFKYSKMASRSANASAR